MTRQSKLGGKQSLICDITTDTVAGETSEQANVHRAALHNSYDSDNGNGQSDSPVHHNASALPVRCAIVDSPTSGQRSKSKLRKIKRTRSAGNNLDGDGGGATKKVEVKSVNDESEPEWSSSKVSDCRFFHFWFDKTYLLFHNNTSFLSESYKVDKFVER